MREANYVSMNIFNIDQVREINNVIKKNLIQGKDNPATAIKTSAVKFVNFEKIQNYINPFVDFCLTANINFFGYDLHPLTSHKKINYNSYETGTEYDWHIDATPKDPVRDIKLTALLNLSEDKYQGGELILFRGKEVQCNEFNISGGFLSSITAIASRCLTSPNKTLRSTLF